MGKLLLNGLTVARGTNLVYDSGLNAYVLGTQAWADPTKTVYTYIAVPSPVSCRQMRLALNTLGLLSTIETFIATQPMATQITWNEAVQFYRDDVLLNALAKAPPFSMTDDQLDDVFILAGTYT